MRSKCYRGAFSYFHPNILLSSDPPQRVTEGLKFGKEQNTKVFSTLTPPGASNGVKIQLFVIRAFIPFI